MIFLLLVFSSCTSHSGSLKSSRPAADDEARTNQELSYGYGQLYKTTSGLKHLDKVNYVKVTSEKIEALVTAIADAARQVTRDLEGLDEQYPSLQIDDPGLPRLELKRRSAIAWDQIFTMAPIVGQSGKPFERTLLLSQLGVLNNLRFLAEVIKDAEKSAARKRVVTEIHRRFEGLYHRVLDLLEHDYFCAVTVPTTHPGRGAGPPRSAVAPS
jgi:hypothetical protein